MPDKNPISKDMTLGELVTRYPKAAVVLAEKGMHCIGCGMAAWETVEQGCKAHGMTDEQVEETVKEMNKAASEDKEKQ